MKSLIGLLITFASAIIFLANPLVVFAATLAEQTGDFSTQLNVWQAIQELGSNLNGKAGTFTFRVSTARTNLNQFDYTAQNTRIYDKDNNNSNIIGCIPPGANSADTLRGLFFNTASVPAGYEDVSIDFSCRNYNFIPGHRYLIFITNANLGNQGSGQILFAAGAYGPGGTQTNDFFPGGGLRYANGNPWDYSHNSGSCNPVTYLWNDQTINPTSGCNIWTSPKDDLYFNLTDNPSGPIPTPTPTPTPTPIPSKTPLILIPGIGGSELKVAEDTVWNKDDGHGGTFYHAYSKDEKVWVNEGEAANPGEDDYFDVLRMKTNGTTSEANLDLTGNLYSRAYGGAINFFTTNGYTLNQDFFVFPYDWRKDISTIKTDLDNKINQIRNQTGSQKVDIVAHSMGGLVARNYIADSSKAQNVRKLFTLGTPHLGSVKFLKAIRFGDCLFLEIGPICPLLAPSEINDILQNMISGFQLSPSQAYFNFYSDEDNEHPYPYRTEGGTLNYNQIKTLLTNFSHNTPLFNPSETFHSLDNNLSNTNGVDITIIAGSGVQTLGQIIEKTTTTLNGNKIIYKDRVDINGDGAVPLLSASISDPHKGLFLNGNAQVFYTNQEHGGLVFNGPTLNLVKNILGGNDQLPSGISIQPFKLSGHGLSVHSPVNIHVYDTTGNHTGLTTDGFEANIPGSSYDTLGDAKFVWLPNSGTYTVKFESTGEGNFDFKIKDYQNDINDKTILYKNVPLTTSTKVQTTFDTSSVQSPVLQLDSDGNGTTDQQITSTAILTGNANYDQTAPKTTVKLTGTIGSNNWYKSDVLIELLPQDEVGGSGIAKTEYSLDNGQTIQVYTTPFTIPQEGINKLKFRSTDQAGNEEAPHEVEIKIDKTAPEAKISFNIPNQTLEIAGIDNLTTVQVSGSAEEQILTDEAGNITKLKLKLDEKENEREKDNKEKQEKEEKKKRNILELKSISYNNDNIIKFPENKFEVKLELDKKTNNIKEFTQSIEIEKQIEIEANYNAKKNETKIEFKKQEDKEQKEEKTGLIILYLMTNKGNLEVRF